MSVIFDGKALSLQIRAEIAESVKKLTEKNLPPPGLAVVVVGSDKASHVYASSKKKACEAAGFKSIEIELPAEATQQELINAINKLNEDKTVHGILLQIPLPKHINEHEISRVISQQKDVDGFNPINVGNLHIGLDAFVPCTPQGVIEIIKRQGIKTEGKNALVVGRSNIVGKPMAALLTAANATVTVAHSRTKNLPELVSAADILVAAIGKAELIKGEWVKEGAVVFDVGTNSIEDKTSPKGYRLVGDVGFEEAKKRASFITPVPGGVGSVTTAMLLSNTLKAYYLLNK